MSSYRRHPCQLDFYSISSDSWTSKDIGSGKLKYGGSAAYSASDNNIYLFGFGVPEGSSNEIYKFDPTTENLTILPVKIPTAILHAGAISIDNEIWLLDGFSGTNNNCMGTPIKFFQIFNVTTQTFRFSDRLYQGVAGWNRWTFNPSLNKLYVSGFYRSNPLSGPDFASSVYRYILTPQ